MEETKVGRTQDERTKERTKTQHSLQSRTGEFFDIIARLYRQAFGQLSSATISYPPLSPAILAIQSGSRRSTLETRGKWLTGERARVGRRAASTLGTDFES